MKILFLIFFVIPLASCVDTNSNPDQELVFFANNFEIMAETKNTVPTLSARLLKLREFGECDNGKCPVELVYIAISEFGEYPEQKLYITKKANEWHFLGWEHIPALGEKDQVITFKMKSKINGTETEYRIKANLRGIEYL